MPHLKSRAPHFLAYDSPDKHRRTRALEAARAYSIDPQLSVHEVPLTPGEARDLWQRVAGRTDEGDSLILLRLDPRHIVHRLGMAAKPPSDEFGYLG